MKRTRLAGAVTLVSVLLAVAACEVSEKSTQGRDDTFIFASGVKPTSLDPIFSDDSDSLRITQQMYQTLLEHRPGTVQLSPGLAEDWELIDGGKTIVLQLRQAVKFHDGTDFNADAVCFNFERWYNTTNAAEQRRMLYYTDVFEGFKQNALEGLGSPVYNSCKTNGKYTVEIHLNRYKGALPAALTLPSFSISSPAALRKYHANSLSSTAINKDGSLKLSEYAYKYPTGTGPFKFKHWDRKTGTVTLVRNENYSGNRPLLARLEFRAIANPQERKNQLLKGHIDGYDYPAFSDYQELEQKKFKVHIRPPFNVSYLGINQAHNIFLSDIRVRKAIAHAINREALLKDLFPAGAKLATQFVPEASSGYASDVVTYGFDQGKARELLRLAGATNLKLNFYYPESTDRPYMSNPKEIYNAISQDLQAVGIEIVGKALPWEEYLHAVRDQGEHDLELLGWTGDYNDAGNFVGTFFGREKPEFGFDQRRLFDQIAAADREPDSQRHTAAYQQVNRDLMEKYLPAVPLVNSPPALVTASDIRGMVVSPLTAERFETLYRK